MCGKTWAGSSVIAGCARVEESMKPLPLYALDKSALNRDESDSGFDGRGRRQESAARCVNTLDMAILF